MSLLFLTDIINRIGIDPKEVKLIRMLILINYSNNIMKREVTFSSRCRRGNSAKYS